MISISVITPTVGTPYRLELLERAKASLAPQLREGDEHLIRVAPGDPWGMRTRNELMAEAKGDLLMFLDDDDEFLPAALNLAGAYANKHPGEFLVFQMARPDGEIIGGRGTPCFVVPREHPNGPLGRWEEGLYEGDQKFLATTTFQRNQDPTFIEIPIARIY